jgi:peptide/nickel transport system permease protein
MDPIDQHALNPADRGAEEELRHADARADDQEKPLAPGSFRRVLRNTMAVVGGTVLIAALLVGIFAPVLAQHDPTRIDLTATFVPPVWSAGGDSAHLLGTDALGRDLMSRVIWGARTSITIAGIAVIIAAILGTVTGLLAGYMRGAVDAVIMRVVDVMLAFPFLLLAIAAIAFLGASIVNLIGILVIRGWAIYARTLRNAVRSENSRPYTEAARAVGMRRSRILFRHIFPNVISPLLVISSFQFAQFVITESSLGFLGLGVPPPTPSWGGMLSDARQYLATAPWLGIFPGLAIVLVVLGANVFGDGLRDALDPRLEE